MKNINKYILDNDFISGLCELIIASRSVAARSIDTIQVITSFEIGHRIVEREQQGEERAEYGKKLFLNYHPIYPGNLARVFLNAI